MSAAALAVYEAARERAARERGEPWPQDDLCSLCWGPRHTALERAALKRCACPRCPRSTECRGCHCALCLQRGTCSICRAELWTMPDDPTDQEFMAIAENPDECQVCGLRLCGECTRQTTDATGGQSLIIKGTGYCIFHVTI